MSFSGIGSGSPGGLSIGQRGALDPLPELMERYASGDDTVFERLYRALGPQVRSFCRRLAGHVSDADDLFQETFLKLHRARATYMRGASVLPWVLAIARSAHLDRLKYRCRRPEHIGDMNDASEDELLWADDSDGPEARAVARELALVVSTALRSMTERKRLAYVLLREQGLSVKDAAAVLGTTSHAVKQRAHRACEHIRAAVQTAGWEEDTHERSRHAVPIEP